MVESVKKELNLVYLELNWEDVISYVIKAEELVQCACFIHQARTTGGSVLVHCAHVSEFMKINVHNTTADIADVSFCHGSMYPVPLKLSELLQWLVHNVERWNSILYSHRCTILYVTHTRYTGQI